MSKTTPRTSVAPWALDRSNIFAAPWLVGTTESPKNPKLKQVIIQTQGNGFAFYTPQYTQADLNVVRPACAFLSDVVSAVAKVRGNADYQSSQHVIALHRAALDIMKVIKKLQEEHPALLDSWRQARDEVVGAPLRALDTMLRVVWPYPSRRAFAERLNSGQRLEYFKYHFSPLSPALDSIVDLSGREFLFFSYPAAHQNMHQSQIQRFKDMKKTEKTEMQRLRSARYAYWSVVLEFSNAFMHLDENNRALPQNFPQLVNQLRILYEPLKSLAAILANTGISYALPLTQAVGIVGDALGCFDSPKDRNLEFEKLSPVKRREHYRIRSAKYHISNNNSHQGDFSLS